MDWVAAMCGVISILLTGCSTIVKGTQQQVSVATPGVQDAMCTLHLPSAPAPQTPGTIRASTTSLSVASSNATPPGLALASETEIMTADNVVLATAAEPTPYIELPIPKMLG